MKSQSKRPSKSWPLTIGNAIFRSFFQIVPRKVLLKEKKEGKMKLLQKDVYIIAISNTAGEDCVLESHLLRNIRRYEIY